MYIVNGPRVVLGSHSVSRRDTRDSKTNDDADREYDVVAFYTTHIFFLFTIWFMDFAGEITFKNYARK